MRSGRSEERRWRGAEHAAKATEIRGVGFFDRATEERAREKVEGKCKLKSLSP